MSQDL
jgi:hypothetical protein